MGNISFVIWIIGWLIALLGILFIAKPEAAKWLMRFVNRGVRLYLVAAIRIILAIVYFVGASRCRIPWAIITLGIILLVSGITILAINLNKLKSMVRWWEEKPTIVIRIVCVMVLIFGVVTVYSALR